MSIYYKKYYLEHKKEMIEASLKWQKADPNKIKVNAQRYRDKVRGGPVLSNTNIYRKCLGEKELFLIDYGANLDKLDRGYQGDKRSFCLDCADRRNCNGWDSCEYKNGILELIKEGG
jgi:hypothetical protein